MKFYAKRLMDKQVEIYRRNGNSYKNMPFWINHFFVYELTHLEVSIGEYGLYKWDNKPYKGAFV